jgi:hypothetical protein
VCADEDVHLGERERGLDMTSKGVMCVDDQQSNKNIDVIIGCCSAGEIIHGFSVFARATAEEEIDKGVRMM